jgi:hypothetical protein
VLCDFGAYLAARRKQASSDLFFKVRGSLASEIRVCSSAGRRTCSMAPRGACWGVNCGSAARSADWLRLSLLHLR